MKQIHILQEGTALTQAADLADAQTGPHIEFYQEMASLRYIVDAYIGMYVRIQVTNSEEIKDLIPLGNSPISVIPRQPFRCRIRRARQWVATCMREGSMIVVLWDMSRLVRFGQHRATTAIPSSLMPFSAASPRDTNSGNSRYCIPMSLRRTSSDAGGGDRERVSGDINGETSGVVFPPLEVRPSDCFPLGV